MASKAVSGSSQRDYYHPYCFSQMSQGEMRAAYPLAKGTENGVNFQRVSTRGTCVFCHRNLSAAPPDLLEGLSTSLPNGGVTWKK